MNLKEELSKTIYSNHDKVPFDDTAQLCEQICLRYAIEVLEALRLETKEYNLDYECGGFLIEKIEELKSKLAK